MQVRSACRRTISDDLLFIKICKSSLSFNYHVSVVSTQMTVFFLLVRTKYSLINDNSQSSGEKIVHADLLYSANNEGRVANSNTFTSVISTE